VFFDLVDSITRELTPNEGEYLSKRGALLVTMFSSRYAFVYRVAHRLSGCARCERYVEVVKPAQVAFQEYLEGPRVRT
jgi:hypothetical protein